LIGRTGSGLFDEIFVIENVRRGANKLEAYTHVALVTRWERFSAMHDYLVRLTMGAIVNHFIDPSLRHGYAGKKHLAVAAL
jgi:hypothetical protein